LAVGPILKAGISFNGAWMCVGAQERTFIKRALPQKRCAKGVFGPLAADFFAKTTAFSRIEAKILYL
jgi:hypothetical protein